MLISHYIEDIFLEFYQRIIASQSLTNSDIRVCHSFFNIANDQKPLTEKQAAYMIMLMKKHKNLVCDNSFDYTKFLENPKFKNPFRVVDTEKKVWVEKSKDGTIVLCCKFPFNFKAVFEKELDVKNNGVWDPEKQARLIPFYEVNQAMISEFLTKHGFELDQSFLHAMSETEAAWDDIETISPKSTIDSSEIRINSSNEYVLEYFQNNKSGNTVKDQFLAKSMGYPISLGRPANSPIEKIVTSKNNTFWIKSNEDLLKIYSQLECKIAIVLDRNDRNQNWIEDFVKSADSLGISRSKIKVCFRDQTNSKEQFNAWIKDNNLGGKVDEGDIFLFDNKPAKWIFKEKNFIKIAVSSSKYPPTNVLTGDWLSAHSCAVYLSDIKPTVKGNKKLVNL